MGISRIEQPEKNNFGYYVRLTRRGVQHAKFFADKKFGGKRKALQAAKQHFELLAAQMPLEPSAGRKTVRNTSGCVGVSRTSSTRKGHEYFYWQASWGSGERRKSVKFSIKKYGEKRARRMAIRARRRWQQEAIEDVAHGNL